MPGLKKVMIVDDETNMRNLLSDILSGAGFQVSQARDGRDSLRQMKNQCFDLLVTDLHMPRLDGIGLLKRMKRAGRKERVIIMTGDPFDPSELKDEIPPVSIQLKKPFQLNHFLEVVASALKPERRKKRLMKPVKKRKRALNAV
jgi:DNA-binding NtrC family response regulator